jgi:hypothetical protein
MSKYEMSFDDALTKSSEQAVLAINPKAQFGMKQTQAITNMLAMYYAGYENGYAKRDAEAKSQLAEIEAARRMFKIKEA